MVVTARRAILKTVSSYSRIYERGRRRKEGAGGGGGGGCADVQLLTCPKCIFTWVFFSVFPVYFMWIVIYATVSLSSQRYTGMMCACVCLLAGEGGGGVGVYCVCIWANTVKYLVSAHPPPPLSTNFLEK